MPLDKTLSDFELTASQNVSNSIKKVVSFRKVNSKENLFSQSLAKLRESSFYLIFTNQKEHLILALDQAIISSWLGSSFQSLGEKEFTSLKESTSALAKEVLKYFNFSQTGNWELIRWETHPNFLAVISSQNKVQEFEFNVHIGRSTGKLWIITDQKTGV